MLNRSHGLWLMLGWIVLTAGCNIGPEKLPEDGMAYNHALRNALQEQILLNLVRLRHGEPTEFLTVEAINSQHSIDRSGLLRGDLLEGGPDLFVLSGSVTTGESPVISFAPTDNCEAFNRRMHVPLDEETLRELTDGGWEIDRILKTTVTRINGFSNTSIVTADGASRFSRNREGFEQVCSLLRTLQDEDRLRLRVVEYKEPHDGTSFPSSQLDLEQIYQADQQGYEVTVAEEKDQVRVLKRERWLAVEFLPEDLYSPEVIDLQQLLGVPAGTRYIEFRGPDVLLPQGGEKHQGESFITVEPRSLFGVFRFLSQGVPGPVPVESSGTQIPFCPDPGIPLAVHVSEEKPDCALVAVCHQGLWYSVSSGDRNSVATFSMLVELYRMQITCAGTPAEVRPLLTIPLSTP